MVAVPRDNLTTFVSNTAVPVSMTLPNPTAWKVMKRLRDDVDVADVIASLENSS